MKPPVSLLDLRVGARLLAKYPGLTVVAGLAIAFAICVGASGYEMVRQMSRPDLPIPDGDRLVGVRLFNPLSSGVETQIAYDLRFWREEVESIEHLGAFRSLDRNISAEDQLLAVAVAEISASAFPAAGTAPLLGRTLDMGDEQPGAPPVVVIGYEVWQQLYGGSPEVVGRTVRVGSQPATVVGVMPEGFAFPVFHGAWVPLRVLAEVQTPGEGPALLAFGRLRPGVSMEQARAELAPIVERTAAAFPEDRGDLVPQVLPYAPAVTGYSGWIDTAVFAGINLFLLMLVVLSCGNVALLLFARAASRGHEIAIRSAIGAARARILGQFFVEALVLAAVAAGVGFFASRSLLGWMVAVFDVDGDPNPFWIEPSFSGETVVYAVTLTILTAAIAGILPALKVTGRGLEPQLRRGSQGSGAYGFRGIWTGVIVAQVAMTLVFPAMAFFAYRTVSRVAQLDVGFPVERYLTARLELESPPGVTGAPTPAPSDAAGPDASNRMTSLYRDLEQRLLLEPAVSGVTFTSRLPRTLHPQQRFEIESVPPPESRIGHPIGQAEVDVGFFDLLGAPILSGRSFRETDVNPETGGIVVNQSFVEQVIGGRNPLGMRIREVTPRYDESGTLEVVTGPWREIVGVVPDMGTVAGDMDATNDPGLYVAAPAGDASPIHLMIRVDGTPIGFAPRLTAIAATIDPALQLHEVLPLDQVGTSLWLEMDFLSRLLVLASSLALLLSLCAIYSVLSFTVARRTREIGIRVALGADRPRVVTAIFKEPIAQVAAGILTGAGLVGLLGMGMLDGSLSPARVAAIGAYALAMLGVCVLACIVPTRRAMAIEPTEAMRVD